MSIGAKLFEHSEHINMARKLVDGCIWSYFAMPTGLMPEYSEMIACEMNSECTWNQTLWEEHLKEKAPTSDNSHSENRMRQNPMKQVMESLRLQKGFIGFKDRRYILRPEAIESVFIHYRLTGDKDLPDKAWRMYTAIENATRTDFANAAILDVTVESSEAAAEQQQDSMESFWLAETLKYFYLIFRTPDVVNLNEWVLNTEAHTFKRPTAGEPIVAVRGKGHER